jgi:negative regulator of replication initiation
MKTIRISNEVWSAIAERGKFGETPDDVLRRVFGINSVHKANERRRVATRKLSVRVENGELLVAFADGPSRRWPLPHKDNKMEIRMVREKALAFAEQQGATEGQLKGVIKAMTSAGFYLIK